jgi:hypothetical protein
MSFGGRAYGGFMDYEGLMPRRIRRWFWRAVMVFALICPSTFMTLNMEYANRIAEQRWKQVEPQLLKLFTPSTTAPPAP